MVASSAMLVIMRCFLYCGLMMEFGVDDDVE